MNNKILYANKSLEYSTGMLRDQMIPLYTIVCLGINVKFNTGERYWEKRRKRDKEIECIYICVCELMLIYVQVDYDTLMINLSS